MDTTLLELDSTVSMLEAQDTIESLTSFIQKQAPGKRVLKPEVACMAGYHAHPGRTCHPKTERHKGKAVEAMGGEQVYWSTHPFAKPKKGKEGAKKRRGGPVKKPTGKKLTEKWFDNSDTEALLSEKYDSIEDRKQAMLGTIPEKWHDRVEFNNEVLTQPDPKIFATSEKWLFKYNTTNPKTGKENQHVVYSKNHLDKSEIEKWERLKTVSKDIGRIRSYADQLLQDNNPQNQAIGAAIHLIDVTGFRVGGEKYVEENGTYGITSLEKGHVKLLSNNKVELNFIGKHNVSVERRRFTVSPKLHQYLIDATKGRKSQPLFPINDGHVRRALEQFGVKPKDLRTFKVNMLLVHALNSGPQYKGDRAKRENHLKEVVETVAAEIGHGAAISRKSYMHPLLLRAYLDGNTYPSIETLFKQDAGGVDDSDEGNAEGEEQEPNYSDWVTAEEKRFLDFIKNIHLA